MLASDTKGWAKLRVRDRRVFPPWFVVLPMLCSPLAFGQQRSMDTAQSLSRPGWWQRVQADVRQMEYEVSWQEGCVIPGERPGYHVTNRAHDLRAYFYPGSIKVVRRTEQTPSWVWEYQLTEFGREDGVQPLPGATWQTEGNRIQCQRGRVREIYENSETGIRQTIVIGRRPEGSGLLVLAARVGNDLEAKSTGDHAAVGFFGCGTEVLRYGGLRVADADGRELSSGFDLDGRRLRILVSDAGAAYPIVIDAVITGTSAAEVPSSRSWVVKGDQSGCRLGFSVSTAGDINNDGYADVIIGIPDYDGGEADEGAVLVFHGSVRGPAEIPAATAMGDQFRACFGTSVGTAGDVNGDGYDDAIVGAPYYSNSHLEGNEGFAFVYLGSAGGLSLSPAWTAESNQADAHLGWSVGTAGDVNGDGYDDVIVGAPDHQSKTTGGSAFVWHGSEKGLGENGTPANPAWRFGGVHDGSELGSSVATAGDVNGDGCDDVIVGEPAYSVDVFDGRGRAYVFHGSRAGLGTVAALTVAGDKSGEQLGTAVGTAGDVNGDDYTDIVVGVPGYGSGEAGEGAAFVYYGSNAGLGGTPHIFEGDHIGAHFGSSVGTAGDVDGDGYDDVIAGAADYDSVVADGGAALVFPGSADGLVDSPLWRGDGDQEGADYGAAVAAAGDVNGDGYADIIVGAPHYDSLETDEGAAFVYYGSATGPRSLPYWWDEADQAEAHFGASVCTAGDVNGDGFDDAIVGAPDFDAGELNQGAAFVYHGSAAGLSARVNWTAGGNQEAARFGASVATAGDVNGDGYCDVVVGAPCYDDGQNDEGRAYVYLGSSAGLRTAPGWMVDIDQADAHFGNAVATAGDVNGDGYSDVIVGATGYTNDQASEGRAYVFHGSGAGLAVSPAWWAEGDQVDSEFGVSVGTAGDVNGDGYADVVVGRPYWNGAAYFWYGSGTGLGASGNPLNADWTAEGDELGCGFGRSANTAGDVNGDGYADVVIGAPGYGTWASGKAFVYHGSATGLDAEGARSGGTPANADWSRSGMMFEGLGTVVSTAGDVNGDGYGDVLITAGGMAPHVSVCFGSAGGIDVVDSFYQDTPQSGDGFGSSAAVAGDVNGDGYSDLIVGAPGFTGGQSQEGRVYVFYRAPKGLSETNTWSAESDQQNADFGVSVATAGDVNGDGYADVIVGAPQYDDGQADEGRAYVYHGMAGGLNPTPSWMVESEQIGALLGQSVATAGDVNGDGYSDVVIGAPGVDQAFVYHGSAAGLTGSSAWASQPAIAGTMFGSAVATAGDVNGDGYSDVIIGAYAHRDGLNRGLAYIHHGSPSGMSATPERILDGGYRIFARFGTSVGTAGDVNGDGYDDAVIGAPGYGDGEAREGALFVYYGSHSGLDPSHYWVAESNQGYAWLGHSAGTVGDVNGDGYADVIAGAPWYDANNLNDAGRAFLWYGSATGLDASGTRPSGNPENVDWIVESDQADGLLGYSVGTAGDVNGDGLADVIIGVPGRLPGGSALAWYGSAGGFIADGTMGNADWWGWASNSDAAFGSSVGTAGDVNGDGFADVVVGAHLYDNGQTDEGVVFVFHGNERSGVDFLPRQIRADQTAPIAHRGISDSSSSFRLALLASASSGRSKARMEWEVKPLGAHFDGAGTQQTTVWTDTGVAGAGLSERVDGLLPGMVYHWRVRLIYHPAASPCQLHSRWLSVPWDGWQEADLRTPNPPPEEMDWRALFELAVHWHETDYAGPIDLYPDHTVDASDLLEMARRWHW